MTRPKKDEPRASIYLVDIGRNEFLAGTYVGETTDKVVLSLGGSARGFAWKDVTPVELKPTD